METVDKTIATLPGSRFATFWASQDGTTVINFAQLESKEIYDKGQATDTALDSGVPELVDKHGAQTTHFDSFGLARQFGT